MTATISRRLVLAWGVLAGAAVTAVAQPLDWKGKFSNSSYLHGALVLPEEQFSAKTTEDAAQTVLREVAGKPFATVDIYPAEQFPPVHYMLFSHIGYEWWRRLFPEYPRFSAARVVVIKGNAVFEYSDLKNGVTRKVLRGADPLVLTTPRGSLTLLSFTFRRTALAAAKGLEPESLEVFAETREPLELSTGITFLEEVHRQIPISEIVFFVRNDLWFLDISGFPIEYPFRERTKPPTKEEFLASTTLLCGTDVFNHANSCTALRGH